MVTYKYFSRISACDGITYNTEGNSAGIQSGMTKVYQARKRNPNPNFSVRIFSVWVGAKKFGVSLETREIKLFWWAITGFCRDIPGGAQKV